MFQGSIVAMVTPMNRDGLVDEAALARLVEFHIENGTDAIVAVGTTGESATLDPDEHCHVIDRVVEIAAGRVPVIGGTGANSTREAIHLTGMAKDAGVDACLLVTPYYNKPTQHGLYQHFKAIAEAVEIPQILYNVPPVTCCRTWSSNCRASITSSVSRKRAVRSSDSVSWYPVAESISMS